MQPPVFRKVAVKRLSSPEQLDQLMQVTTPMGWLALLALGGILVAGIVWGFVGSVPTRITASGILLRAGGVSAVAAETGGRLTALSVSVGDVVSAGQVIGRIAASGGVTTTDVVSPYAGRVVEVVAGPGALVDRGARLLSLVDESRPLEAVLYLSPEDGKKVKAGMPAQIAPSTVAEEQYGYMLGSVRQVGEFPSTYEGMFALIQNEDLVRTLRAGGAPIEVRVELRPDPSPASVSHYAWSSPAGPPVQVENGTLAAGTITIGDQRPITLVLPFIR